MAFVEWINREDIRPFIYIRRENRVAFPGVSHPIDWFNLDKVLDLDPMRVKTQPFAEAIYNLEGNLFSEASMRMPRWVFYDCAIMPGITVGFAMHRDSMNQKALDLIQPTKDLEWIPISLFIAIPTNANGQWVAHNLCSVNTVLDKDERLYALGFLTKAFGLWYANIRNLCGMTQWDSPAIKLHTQYGHLEILTAFTPIHTHPQTVTYRTWVDSRLWYRFFSKSPANEFEEFYEPSDIQVDPKNEENMRVLQRAIERGAGPFYLSSQDMLHRNLDDVIQIYKLRKHLREKIRF
tara:strand:+ start:11457 stop:12335 length:879 start_codon:yes stop_codon:yes gene_type:complete